MMLLPIRVTCNGALMKGEGRAGNRCTRPACGSCEITTCSLSSSLTKVYNREGGLV